MTTPKTRLIGATAIAALALAGALVAWQASSDSPADLAQLSDNDKLEILNSGDADAISELLEAEEARVAVLEQRRQRRGAELVGALLGGRDQCHRRVLIVGRHDPVDDEERVGDHELALRDDRDAAQFARGPLTTGPKTFHPRWCEGHHRCLWSADDDGNGFP